MLQRAGAWLMSLKMVHHLRWKIKFQSDLATAGLSIGVMSPCYGFDGEVDCFDAMASHPLINVGTIASARNATATPTTASVT